MRRQSAARKMKPMNRQLLIGLLLLIAGVTLFLVGANASHSIAGRVNETFYGRFSAGTTWYFFGGLVAAAVGLYLLVVKLFARSTLSSRFAAMRRK